MPVEENLQEIQSPDLKPEALITGEGSSLIEAAQLPETEKLEFTDSRGVVRKPHELAAEVILSDEIQTAVDDHFGEVYGALPQIDSDLDQLEGKLAQRGEHHKQAFNPFDETFLGEIRAKVREQIDNVSEEQPTTKVIDVEKKGLFGRTKTVQQTVETTERVAIEGYTLDFSEREKENIVLNHRIYEYRDWDGRDEHGNKITRTREETRDGLIKSLQKQSEALLCDDVYDSYKMSAQNVSGQRLPLLAKRLFDAGVEPDELDEETLYRLVPELEPVKKAVEVARDIIDVTIIDDDIGEIRAEIGDLLPDSQFLTSIYYSDEDLAEIAQRYDRLRQLVGSVYPEKVADVDNYRWHETATFLESARSYIEAFFTHAVPADELLMHSTPFAPRVIESGYIKPTAAMSDDEFTFNTRRKHDEKLSHEGSNAVHWSGLNRLVYDFNQEPGYWLGKETGTKYEVEQEQSKGGFGQAVIGVRVGDIVGSAPYYGSYTNSDEYDRTRDEHTHKQAVIRLTEAGYQKIAQKLANRVGVDDCVYTAAPASASKEEAFNYAISIEQSLIAIGSKSREPVLAALREAGWSDEAIAELTYIYDTHLLSQTDIPQEMQENATEQGKYRNCVVGNLSRRI